jgi:hypothetical protein
MVYTKQSLGHVLSGLDDLMKRLASCVSEDEKKAAMRNWARCCLVNNPSAPKTMNFIFTSQRVGMIEDAIKEDMAMLKERIKDEEERLESAKELHSSIMEFMSKGTKNKHAKQERANKKKRGHF